MRVAASARLRSLTLGFIGGGVSLLMLIAARPAQAEALVTALSGSRVEITSTYTGAEIVVFGVIERDGSTVSRSGDYDVVVTVRGPKRNFIVRKKEQIGFAWLNRERRRFNGLPSYLAVLSTRTLDQVTTPELRRRFTIGIDAHMTTAEIGTLPERERDFMQALRRLEGVAGRFVEDSAGVAFLAPNFFRSSIYLPAIAPTGLYEVETKLFSGGALLARSINTFEVVKTGFEQRIAQAADSYGVLYGLAIAALALLFGWLASVVFRRD